MKKILNEWNKFLLNETSISRVYKHILEHDTAFITGYRNDPKDMSKCLPLSSKIPKNKDRNKELKAVLMEKGYGVTAVKGTYVENFGTDAAEEVKEASYFVVNLNDDPDFEGVIRSLSEHYCQDSYMYVPQGGEDGILVGTNFAVFPGYGNRSSQGPFIGGVPGEFMSRVGKRQRVIKFAEGLDTKKKMQNNSKYLISKISKKVMKEIADKQKK